MTDPEGSSESVAARGEFGAWREPLEDGTLRLRYEGPRGRVSWGDVIALWQRSDDFVAAFTESLARAPYEAFFWETPPVTAGEVERPFECVVVEGPALARMTAYSRAFDEHLRGGDPAESVRTFGNLGGDAVLVAPCPWGDGRAYAHLAAFVRGGPAEQVGALWAAVGRALERRLAERAGRCWVSTSGLGVPWVHVRLDSRPKYYVHAPYR